MTTRPRRVHERLEISLDVTIQIADREVEATCLNISQGGMFLRTEHIPMGETVRVSFKLPDLPKTIVADARVCWSEKDARQGVGVQFVGLRAIEVWAINQLFQKKSRGEP